MTKNSHDQSQTSKGSLKARYTYWCVHYVISLQTLCINKKMLLNAYINQSEPPWGEPLEKMR